MIAIDIWLHFGSEFQARYTKMQNKMNMKNKTQKCVPRNSQINLSAQEFN